MLRIEDLDGARCRAEFRQAILEDLGWFGIEWNGGAYFQSERRRYYLEAWEKLRGKSVIYPCRCSRRDVAEAALAPHEQDPHHINNEEPVYPGTCRPPSASGSSSSSSSVPASGSALNWRFQVPDGEEMRFTDVRLGEQRAVAGSDFGDFIVWRRDDVPAYQLAVMVDDALMHVTEVVRGEDLLRSTFRQLLLYRALELEPPRFYHTPLILDAEGKRLAKRHAALSLRALRESGVTPEEIRERYG